MIRYHDHLKHGLPRQTLVLSRMFVLSVPTHQSNDTFSLTLVATSTLAHTLTSYFQIDVDPTWTYLLHQMEPACCQVNTIFEPCHCSHMNRNECGDMF